MTSIHLRITDRCDLLCGHCCYPTSKHGHTMSKDDIDKLAKNLPSLYENILLTGGEVFQKEDMLFYALEQLKGKRISLQTSGSWAKDREYNLKKLEQLKAAGVKAIAITSDDKYHEQRGLNIFKVNSLCKQMVEVFGYDEVKMFGGNADKVFPIGRGARLPANKHSLSWSLHCQSKNYSISPDGSLYPCCWQITPPLGNMIDDDFETIMAKVKQDPLLNAINTGDLESIAQQCGVENTHNCKVCYEAFYKKP